MLSEVCRGIGIVIPFVGAIEGFIKIEDGQVERE
jgi:hypothetical protein